MKTIYSTLLTLAFLLGLISCQNQADEANTAAKPPNILFIAVDDLRPELNCYGQQQIISPNLDQLAAEGFLFERAYCNVPVCGASRASLLTGLRPKPDRFLNYNTYADKDAPDAISLPQHFRENGYRTFSYGKVFHHRDDKADSWTDAPWHPALDLGPGASWRDYQLPQNVALDKDGDDKRGPAYERAAVPDSAYFDGKIALRATRTLQTLAGQDQPFFMALGFMKPHLPFNAPAKYWDLYPEASISTTTVPDQPEAAPGQAYHNFGELRHYAGIPDEGPVADSTARKLVHGYYASVSYTDAMIGMVLDELKRLKLDENTIVVLWGDHGWSLGEHGLWCKHSTFNVAMQAPLFIKVPGRSGGKRIGALTEFVDIYPSLCDLSGLPRPGHLQGDSFVPLLDDPTAPGKEALYCRWIRADAVKTDQYLYTEWFDKDGKSIGRMLYDHLADPQETVNIAEKAEHADLVADLSARLRAQRSRP
ncbi:sulfatase [Flavilitoribacter nigricans]|uniref:Iduronate sulfatase n=1 Tax=Flavilitoribacter nigricans (strain ATCC 23147 / DSM 23189 / NBRC 102662 / NCIMB 1420 / SS-2) TaxID=1122177 RepID=A0A2D0MYF6_FLAN2|nr:sulfatase [Flavilitoribacter nigricans]PHN01304.1 iduronate sulfatase [Flavilitoribacter nigricans DSM 23189 = NBRC 102662]